MSKKESTELQVRNELDVVPASFMDGQESAGFDENADSGMQIPFVKLLQALSKEVTGEGGEGIEGAKIGTLYNSVTEELYGTEIVVLPVVEKMLYVEWVPRQSGGGRGAPVARYEPRDPMIRALRAEKDFGKLTHPQTGNDLIQTTYLWALIVHESGDLEPVVISISSTKYRPYTKWRKKAAACMVLDDSGRKRKTGLSNHLIRIGTASETKNGNMYSNLTIAPANGSIRTSLVLDPEDPRLKAATQLREMCSSGQAQMAEEMAEDGGAVVDEDVEF